MNYSIISYRRRVLPKNYFVFSIRYWSHIQDFQEIIRRIFICFRARLFQKVENDFQHRSCKESRSFRISEIQMAKSPNSNSTITSCWYARVPKFSNLQILEFANTLLVNNILGFFIAWFELFIQNIRSQSSMFGQNQKLSTNVENNVGIHPQALISKFKPIINDENRWVLKQKIPPRMRT